MLKTTNPQRTAEVRPGVILAVKPLRAPMAVLSNVTSGIAPVFSDWPKKVRPRTSYFAQALSDYPIQ